MFFKIGSTGQEFDLNVLFKWSPNHCEILNPVDSKKNFVPIKVTNPHLSASQMKIVQDYDNRMFDIISPLKVKLMPTVYMKVHELFLDVQLVEEQC